MIRLNALNWVALILVIIGGVNWGLFGAANIDLVAMLFGAMSTAAKAIYILVGIAAVYLLIVAINGSTNSKAIL